MRLVMTLTILLAAIASASGQEISDTELKAAYCLGVSTAQLNEEKLNAKSAADVSVRELHKDVEGIVAERQKRFRDYLIAKGFASDRDPERLKIAILRGEGDVATCGKDLELSFYKSCSERCRTSYSDASRILACNDKCPTPDACIRVKKCLTNFLPF